MRLVELPTTNGSVWVNPERVLSVRGHREYVSKTSTETVVKGTEVRFEPGGFGGATVITTLTPEATVVKLTSAKS